MLLGVVVAGWAGCVDDGAAGIPVGTAVVTDATAPGVAAGTGVPATRIVPS
jgi:hypothetical protein